MRGLPLILFAACLAGGCASRLPIERGAPIARAEAAVPTWSAAAFQETVDRLGGREACFVRCAAEHAGIVEEVVEEHLNHEIALFLGYTFERGEGGGTVGIDYTYWINRRFGVGPFVDLVLGDIDALAAGAGVWLRPFRELEDLTFYVAPGIDATNEEEPAEEESDEGEGGRSWEVRALVRLGILYGFDLGRGFRFIPSFYADVIFPDKKAFVMGLTLGKEF